MRRYSFGGLKSAQGQRQIMSCFSLFSKEKAEEILDSEDGCVAYSRCSTLFPIESCGSDNDSLGCDEALQEFEEEDELCTPPRQPSPTPEPFVDYEQTVITVQQVLSNESERQHEFRPRVALPISSSQRLIDNEARKATVCWLMEVTNACGLQCSTLFLSVAYLDRYLANGKDVTVKMLQLLATSCISLASKQEEVVTNVVPTAKEWATIAGDSFLPSELDHMEGTVVIKLGWRLRMSTAHSFLHLLLCGVGPLQEEIVTAASFFTELSLLDSNFLRFDYATLAAAALQSAHVRVKGKHHTLSQERLTAIAPFLCAKSVRECMVELERMQAGLECRGMNRMKTRGSSLHTVGSHPLSEKYASVTKLHRPTVGPAH
ncbi:hypothetical protein CEUSTIGMA_g1873.t1 [Chlamydomonas eustigma]|uniref:Cyclin N-terminal domain-containing protein n=1 Tax=Chlamydomonas eustigma TaxID=1157962 RepID=A0A250WUC0_9CHLO|nr:hypothetical protein CEUSTIGMA_g1873.t1 [Chlamydomonas eustigma]|eukprot:GAX74424.1 hypothetical protein CEUSTIGMA_g1873.t1 [Chlamydomonas eustigma]